MLVIGLTGRNASGKGEAATFLARKGFHLHSLSDAIREELVNRGVQETRENMIATGRELRERFGPQVLGERIFRKLEPDKNYCVDSFRNPAEIEYFKRNTDFTLIYIDAPQDVRFSRILKRNRSGDPQTLNVFSTLEEEELRNESITGQQLICCEGMADIRVVNDGDVGEFHRRLSEVVIPLLQNRKRPSWDEYFMEIARVVALRSNCIKRKVAAIIVKDRRIISTGYNGTPRKIRNCNEGGCPRCNSLADSGTGLDECFCSHGEENAIVQSAYHGVKIAGATLYSTYAPCLLWTKMIINSGIVEVVYCHDYPLNDSAFRLIHEAGLIMRRYDPKA